MSGIDDSVLAQLEQLDPDEAAALEEELDAEEVQEMIAEAEAILSYEF